jgi:hypothetical protein
LESLLSHLVKRLGAADLARTGVIPWSSPVPCFGDLSRSNIATLGLNPSNREFVDGAGHELEGPHRRFHTLTSLGLARWSEATARHLRLILEACSAYFLRNPYHAWFKTLDHVISGTKASYYDPATAACHLDLIPYATTRKWTELTSRERSSLLALAGDTLGLLLRDSPVRLLILNGSSVAQHLQHISGVRLERQPMSDWSLPRQQQSHVIGFAYRGAVRHLAGVSLRREVRVLGFNHNIQSSFGVTTEVRAAIRRWIAHTAADALS